LFFKDESFWEKIGTLGRKKKAMEVKEVETDGKYAIDSPGKDYIFSYSSLFKAFNVKVTLFKFLVF
jgi:hypothetical protein